MSLRRARSADEFIKWVQNAVFEVDDLRSCFDFEMDEGGRYPAFLEPLDLSIKNLYEQMKQGTYGFGREDLPFMDIVHRYGDEIPFATLLKQINETHRKGIEVDTDGD
jgi:hypothetical protein